MRRLAGEGRRGSTGKERNKRKEIPSRAFFLNVNIGSEQWPREKERSHISKELAKKARRIIENRLS